MKYIACRKYEDTIFHDYGIGDTPEEAKDNLDHEDILFYFNLGDIVEFAVYKQKLECEMDHEELEWMKEENLKFILGDMVEEYERIAEDN